MGPKLAVMVSVLLVSGCGGDDHDPKDGTTGDDQETGSETDGSGTAGTGNDGSGTGGGGQTGETGSLLPADCELPSEPPPTCDDSGSPGYACHQWFGSGWDPLTLPDRCVQGMFADAGSCPSDNAAGWCMYNPGTPNERLTFFYGPAFTPALAESTCLDNTGTVWCPAQ